MITRFALFDGTIHPGQTDAFRAAVLAELLPLWRAFPGATEVRVCFADDRDAGAPEYPLMLATSYPDSAALNAALASPVRAESRAATKRVLARFFSGKVHHHVTTAHAAGPV